MAVSTIYQPSNVMNSWMTCIPNGYTGSQKLSFQNTVSEQHLKRRSTTLFPMRMNEDLSTSVSRKEITASNYDTVDSNASKYRRVNESLPTNYVPSSSHNTEKSTIDIHENITQKNIELPADSSNLGANTSKQLKENNRKNSLHGGEIPKFLKCYTCERIIKEDHFSEHLLFGTVKCSGCNAHFKDCQSFQLWIIEYAMGNVACNHAFSYASDPVAYLTGKLSTSHAENLVETTKVTALLENYLDKLKSLHEKLPWKHAIKICKDFLTTLKSESFSLGMNIPSSASKDTFGIAKRSKLNSSFTESSWNSERVNFLSPAVEEECIEDFISQDYDLGQLEEATEFVRVPEISAVESLKDIRKKPKEIRKRKKKPQSLVIGENSTKSVEDESLEYVPMRSDGFYYVATKAIEECPNCYEVLCPSKFTVNVKTFLITVVCMGCNLSIYITSPEVQVIMTEEGKKPEAKKVLKDNQKPKANASKAKKPRGRPKKETFLDGLKIGEPS